MESGHSDAGECTAGPLARPVTFARWIHAEQMGRTPGLGTNVGAFEGLLRSSQWGSRLQAGELQFLKAVWVVDDTGRLIGGLIEVTSGDCSATATTAAAGVTPTEQPVGLISMQAGSSNGGQGDQPAAPETKATAEAVALGLEEAAAEARMAAAEG